MNIRAGAPRHRNDDAATPPSEMTSTTDRFQGEVVSHLETTRGQIHRCDTPRSPALNTVRVSVGQNAPYDTAMILLNLTSRGQPVCIMSPEGIVNAGSTSGTASRRIPMTSSTADVA